MKYLNITFTFILSLLLAFNLQATNRTTQKKLSHLHRYYAQAMKDWEVPGMAIAIVKNGEVIFSKGYGVRKAGTNQPVDAYTAFPIASNTKAFTAAAIGILVDRGALNWDDKVIQYLPWFRMYDPWVTHNMTIRDLLCHRSGLKTFSGDLLWYGTQYSRREVIERAQYLKPKYGFREQYGYSNIMFMAAGEVVAAVSGMSWESFIQQNIFDPLHMKRSTLSVTQLEEMDNIVRPHTSLHNNIIDIPYINWDNVGPAGSINSCADDMTHWLLMQLNQGIYEHDTLFSKQVSHEMWQTNISRHVSEGAEALWPTTHFKGYALGWGVMDYQGKKVISHSGGYDGVISYTALVPEENLGLVILTNKNSALYLPLFYKTLDTFLSDDTTDWSELFLQRIKQRGEVLNEPPAHPESTPTLPLEEYCGTYHCKMYGDAEVKLINGNLSVQLLPAPAFKGILTHYQYNTFTVEFPAFPSLPQGTVNFVLSATGAAESLRIEVPNPDFDFTELHFTR